MEIRQLEYFLAVAETLHFGRAAKKLHVTEKPLSVQIAKLERELGFKLFDRTTRRVELTPAGLSYVEDAKRMLRHNERAIEKGRRIAAGKAGCVRLGYESSTVVSILPDFVKLFRAEYPEIDLELSEHSKEGLKPLAAGDTDACLITRYERVPEGIEFMSIASDRAVVALPLEHRLAGRDTLSLTDLDEVPFLGYADSNGESANRFMAQVTEYAGSTAAISHDADTFTALLALVSANLGFTIVTESMSKLFTEEVAYVRLVEPEVGVDYGIAFRKEDSQAIIESLHVVARHLAQIY